MTIRNESSIRTRRAMSIAAAVVTFGMPCLPARAAPPGLPSLVDMRPIEIHYGVNKIPAFTPDGLGATVVKVHRENGNAHSTDALLIAVDGRSPAPGVSGVPQAVDREDPGSAGSGLFGIEPFDGENEIGALRLVHAKVDGRSAVLLLEARRKVDDAPTLVTPTRVDLRVWRLDGPSDAVGRTPYRFVLTGHAMTTRVYCNATSALNKEWGVPYPDGWDNEDTPDGCLSTASAERNAAAQEVVRGLDVTSFPNSIGPRHLAHGTTFAAAGYSVVQAFADGWVQLQPPDNSWQFSVYVMEDGRDHKLVCIGDQSLGGGTYRSMQAIDVSRDAADHWRAMGTPRTLPGCSP